MLTTFNFSIQKIYVYFFKWIYFCPMLSSVPWVKYCCEKVSVMNYAILFFSFENNH
jgi:hypothetical protein